MYPRRSPALRPIGVQRTPGTVSFREPGRTGFQEVRGQPCFRAPEDALTFEAREVPVAVGDVEKRLEPRDRRAAVLDNHGLPAADAIQQRAESILRFGYAGALHLAIIARSAAASYSPSPTLWRAKMKEVASPKFYLLTAALPGCTPASACIWERWS